MKTYGIYLAYQPGIPLQAEGLGRLLVAFMDAARTLKNVRIAIACPSWMRTPLTELFESAGIPKDTFELIGPQSKPVLLRVYDWYIARSKRSKRASPLVKLLGWIRQLHSRAVSDVASSVVSSRSPFFLLFVGITALFVLALASGLYMLAWPLVRAVRWTRRFFSRVTRQITQPFFSVLGNPKENSGVIKLYRMMELAETRLMRDQINARKDILAWYCPTSFWPHVHEIAAPRLICVPDVLLAEFPVGFAAIGGDRFLDVFRLVQKTIEGGKDFVTYSTETKHRTLVTRFHVDPASVQVIPHGASRLDHLVKMSGLPDNEMATDNLCRTLLRRALPKAFDYLNASHSGLADARFIFYASQFRPNKNVISLLRAYDFLLKQRYIGHKLILTGHPSASPEIAQFIQDRNLQSDVICLHKLSEQELAACYRLADLAVNPSLSEGACPFTLTEALSVGTPAVMARIPVTLEVVKDDHLRSIMLFDPYDWKDIAHRIEWGLNNRAQLLGEQEKLYSALVKRTWKNVVEEHIAILDRISAVPAVASQP